MQVNSYPTVRGFTAIGTGGDDFVQSMVVAVESVIEERIPEVGFLCLFAAMLLKVKLVTVDESDFRSCYIWFGSTNVD
jgi:hypothetical protein